MAESECNAMDSDGARIYRRDPKGPQATHDLKELIAILASTGTNRERQIES